MFPNAGRGTGRNAAYRGSYVPFSSRSRSPSVVSGVRMQQPWQPHRGEAGAAATHVQQQQRANSAKFVVGFRRLEEWSKKVPSEIIAELLGQKRGFQELLESSLRGDFIVLVIRILSKLCSSPFKENKLEVLNLASKARFVASLQNYLLVDIPFEDKSRRRFNAHLWNDVDDFFINLAVTFEALIETLPTRACEILPKLLKGLVSTFGLLESEKVTVSDEVKRRFDFLQTKVDACMEKMESKKKNAANEDLEEEEPPDDFREIPVYPTAAEMLSSERAFVRKHRIEGAYDSVSHYLDVQFRLLREDFVAPLREGVSEYLQHRGIGRRVTKFSSVRVHPHVQFLQPRFCKDQHGVLLQFDFKEKKNSTQKNFRYYKRFMFGALVVFTKDNFTSVLLGRILERDAKLLNEGQIVVSFEHGFDNYELNEPYVMVECNVFFEPYYHVLRAMQTMEEENFPMKKYLIDVETDAERPDYVDMNTTYELEEKLVNLTVPESWPNAADLGLDDTQYRAYQSALTRKFVVIQGPPGTGKTYLGLEIAKALLCNRNAWYDRTPILVVCFTNHALDQFLEGLIDTTPNIVRVGGQSKNPRMEKFTLKEKRKKLSISGRISSVVNRVRRELFDELSLIDLYSKTIDEIQKYESVIAFENFKHVIPELKDSWFSKATDAQVLEWLLGGRNRNSLGQSTYRPRQEDQKKEESGDTRLTDSILDDLWKTEERAVDDDVDDDSLMDRTRPRSLTFLVKTSEMAQSIQNLEAVINNLDKQTYSNEVYNNKWRYERELFELMDNLQYLEMRLTQGHRGVYSKPKYIDLRFPYNIAPDVRWQLYFHYLKRYENFLILELVKIQKRYRRIYKQYTELKQIEDTELMKEMLVVGMTTTSAARLQTILQALKCRIVIVEEAAEVLEAHIAVSLTSHCQHLILIGDHQQLRPTTANYRLETHFHLGVSLFERMVRNQMQCHVLGVQHRMRPEIAKLIVPSIYPKLENHESVYNFPQVLGVDPCLYFIDHRHPEEESGDSSKMNQHEAEFLILLARYLIQNGYEPEDITILAAYSGQMFALMMERKKYDLLLHDVRITILDNYQGEECKIILLSLVRNNNEGQVGFLKIENRVCVALSRAKEGFYIMGNIELLCQKSELWCKVRESLKEQNCLGESLALRCQNHREVTFVSTPSEFGQVAEGGCNKICGGVMVCGHKCPSICHVLDREHIDKKCLEACERILCENNHRCPDLCYEKCAECKVPMKRELPCNHELDIPCHVDPNAYFCQVPVEAELPCGHKVSHKPCSADVQQFRCPHPCDTRVEPCGHACELRCHTKNDPDHVEYKCAKPCPRPQAGCSTGEHLCQKRCSEECSPCLVVVKKRRNVCTHVYEVACNVDVDSIKCDKPCKRMLPCEHFCKNKCSEPCGNCQQMVKKVHPICGHYIDTKCCEEPNNKYCKAPCQLKLPCGHPCQELCSKPCTTKCLQLVDHDKRADCGHKFKISCYLLKEDLLSNSKELLRYCKQPCQAKLTCKHLCAGTCGQCAQGRMHYSCAEKCGVPLICGHECPIPCRETCQPCGRPCSYRCRHAKCRKTCGEPCTNCTELCLRKCPHARCLARCGQICTVPPCTEPCAKLLKKCGHPCVGFCGDPCPPLCRQCDKDQLTEIFFGTEDEEDARFVLLIECKHVIESQSMENWLQQGGDAINYKSCPKCKTPLTCTQRYSDYIKTALQDVIKVKQKYYGSFVDNERKRVELLERVENMQKTGKELLKYSLLLKSLLEKFTLSLQPVRRKKRQPLSMILLQVRSSQIMIAESILDIFNKAKLKSLDAITKAVGYINYLVRFLLEQGQRATNQQVEDFTRELWRLERILQLCQIEDTPVFRSVLSSRSDYKDLHMKINKAVFAAREYTSEIHSTLKQELIKLSELMKTGIGITDRERIQIVHAMGMAPGHWYKCPNGHIYYIGECGGATQIGQCNECGARIGGSSHRLLSDNAHAGEMDGSRHAAWSQAALRNYHFVL